MAEADSAQDWVKGLEVMPDAAAKGESFDEEQFDRLADGAIAAAWRLHQFAGRSGETYDLATQLREHLGEMREHLERRDASRAADEFDEAMQCYYGLESALEAHREEVARERYYISMGEAAERLGVDYRRLRVLIRRYELSTTENPLDLREKLVLGADVDRLEAQINRVKMSRRGTTSPPRTPSR
jgi:hypothetical protein